MTHTLQVTDGTTTVAFTSGNNYLAEYTPAVTADLSQPLKEQAVVGMTGATTGEIQAAVNTLNRLFWQAQSYARNHTGPKVYVQFQPQDDADTWRSLLYSGRASPPDTMLGGDWGARNIEFNLEWTRDPFWEGSLTQVPLSNGNNVSPTTDAVTVDNSLDSTHYNYVDISDTDITGDLPAPLKVQMYASTTDGADRDEVYVFHNVYSFPLLFQPIVEAESSSDFSSSTSASASGENYGTVTWSDTDEALIAGWQLPSSDLGDAAGGHFALMARFYGSFPYSDCYLRFKLNTAGKSVWTGNLGQVSATTDGRELVMLDTLRLPPYLEGETSLAQLGLRLYALRTAGGTIDLDYLMFAPISGDAGFLHFIAADDGVPAEETFVHDGIEGLTYQINSFGNKTGNWRNQGGEILLVPNKDQRLYFLMCNSLGLAGPDQTWTVQLWYRPRRFSI